MTLEFEIYASRATSHPLAARPESTWSWIGSATTQHRAAPLTSLLVALLILLDAPLQLPLTQVQAPAICKPHLFPLRTSSPSALVAPWWFVAVATV